MCDGDLAGAMALAGRNQPAARQGGVWRDH